MSISHATDHLTRRIGTAELFRPNIAGILETPIAADAGSKLYRPYHVPIAGGVNLVGAFDVELNRPARGDGHTTRDLDKELIQEVVRSWELAVFLRRSGLAERLCADPDPRLSYPESVGEKATPEDQKRPRWLREQLEKNGEAVPLHLLDLLRPQWGFLWGIVGKHWFHKYKVSKKTGSFFDLWLPELRQEHGKIVRGPHGAVVHSYRVISGARRMRGELKDKGKLAIDRVLDRHSACDNVIDGKMARPWNHGTQSWIRSQTKPLPDQDTKLRFVTQHGPIYNKNGAQLGSQVYAYRDVIKTNLHRDEVKELEKSRELIVKGNTGGWRPLRANEDFVEWASKDGSVEDRVVTKEFTPVSYVPQFEARSERELETLELGEMMSDKPDITFDGEALAFSDDERTEYIPCQIKSRRRGRNKTKDERIEDRAKKARKWEKLRPIAQTIIESGGCSSADSKKNTLEHNGMKVDPCSMTFRHIAYEHHVLNDNYDTKKELGGEHYETFRKKELEEYVVNNKEIPATKFSKEQIADIKANDGRAVYAHIILDRGRWYKLDVDKLETYEAAIHEIWWKSIDEAFKKAGHRSRTKGSNAENPEQARIFKEVASRFEKAFRRENIYILDWRTPTVAAIAHASWENCNQE